MMMDHTIEIEYQGFIITYDEYENAWQIRGFGKNSYESLAKTKEAIDLKNKSASKIEPFTAFVPLIRKYGDKSIRRVEVTPVFANQDVWINGEGIHEKYCGMLFEDTPKNESLIERIEELDRHINEQVRIRSNTFNLLDRIDTSTPLRKAGVKEKPCY